MFRVRSRAALLLSVAGRGVARRRSAHVGFRFGNTVAPPNPTPPPAHATTPLVAANFEETSAPWLEPQASAQHSEQPPVRGVSKRDAVSEGTDAAPLAASASRPGAALPLAQFILTTVLGPTAVAFDPLVNTWTIMAPNSSETQCVRIPLRDTFKTAGAGGSVGVPAVVPYTLESAASRITSDAAVALLLLRMALTNTSPTSSSDTLVRTVLQSHVRAVNDPVNQGNVNVALFHALREVALFLIDLPLWAWHAPGLPAFDVALELRWNATASAGGLWQACFTSPAYPGLADWTCVRVPPAVDGVITGPEPLVALSALGTETLRRAEGLPPGAFVAQPAAASPFAESIVPASVVKSAAARRRAAYVAWLLNHPVRHSNGTPPKTALQTQTLWAWGLAADTVIEAVAPNVNRFDARTCLFASSASQTPLLLLGACPNGPQKKVAVRAAFTDAIARCFPEEYTRDLCHRSGFERGAATEGAGVDDFLRASSARWTSPEAWAILGIAPSERPHVEAPVAPPTPANASPKLRAVVVGPNAAARGGATGAAPTSGTNTPAAPANPPVPSLDDFLATFSPATSVFAVYRRAVHAAMAASPDADAEVKDSTHPVDDGIAAEVQLILSDGRPNSVMGRAVGPNEVSALVSAYEAAWHGLQTSAVDVPPRGLTPLPPVDFLRLRSSVEALALHRYGARLRVQLTEDRENGGYHASALLLNAAGRRLMEASECAATGPSRVAAEAACLRRILDDHFAFLFLANPTRQSGSDGNLDVGRYAAYRGALAAGSFVAPFERVVVPARQTQAAAIGLSSGASFGQLAAEALRSLHPSGVVVTVEGTDEFEPLPTSTAIVAESSAIRFFTGVSAVADTVAAGVNLGATERHVAAIGGACDLTTLSSADIEKRLWGPRCGDEATVSPLGTQQWRARVRIAATGQITAQAQTTIGPTGGGERGGLVDVWRRAIVNACTSHTASGSDPSTTRRILDGAIEAAVASAFSDAFGLSITGLHEGQTSTKLHPAQVPQFVQLLTSRVLPVQLVLSTSCVQGPGFKHPLWRCRVLLVPTAASSNAPVSAPQPLVVDEGEMFTRAQCGVVVEAASASATRTRDERNGGLSDAFDDDGFFRGDVRHALFTGVEARLGDVGAVHTLSKSTRKAVTAKAAWRFFEQNFPIAAAKILRDVPRGLFFDALASPSRDQLAATTAAEVCAASWDAMAKEALHICGVYKNVSEVSRARAIAAIENQQRPVAKVPKSRAKKLAKGKEGGFAGKKKQTNVVVAEGDGLLPPRPVAYGISTDTGASSTDDTLLHAFSSHGGDALDDLFAGGSTRMASIDGRRAPQQQTPPKAAATADAGGDMTALLKRLLLERRNTQLRITAARVGPGIHVVLYGTPRCSGSPADGPALLDFAAERELGDAIDQSEARATRVACIRILQELFPDELLAHMEAHNETSLPL